MGGVFANGLEISGKAVSAKTIAAFPDVCFTPPENPATPPGVPIPYPNFAMAADTEKGSGTVFIKGKTVNLKNKSDMSKTSGDEAGCAAKKGVITSKNTGKSYFNSWSPDVKFDGEPVVRMSDMTTNNHASPVGNAPPWVHIAKMNKAGEDCETVYLELNGHPHTRSKTCEYSKTGNQSEHTIRVSAIMADRTGKKSCNQFPNYKESQAPCICMNTTHMTSRKKKRKKSPNTDTPHTNKTQAISDWLKKSTTCSPQAGRCSSGCKVPTIGQLMKKSADETVKNHKETEGKSKKEKEDIADCLSAINMAYIAEVDEDDSRKDAKKKVADSKKKKICSRAVCTAGGTRCRQCGQL